MFCRPIQILFADKVYSNTISSLFWQLVAGLDEFLQVEGFPATTKACVRVYKSVLLVSKDEQTATVVGSDSYYGRARHDDIEILGAGNSKCYAMVKYILAWPMNSMGAAAAAAFVAGPPPADDSDDEEEEDAATKAAAKAVRQRTMTIGFQVVFLVHWFTKVTTPGQSYRPCPFTIVRRSPAALAMSWSLLDSASMVDHAYICPDFGPHSYFLLNDRIIRD